MSLRITGILFLSALAATIALAAKPKQSCYQEVHFNVTIVSSTDVRFILANIENEKGALASLVERYRPNSNQQVALMTLDPNGKVLGSYNLPIISRSSTTGDNESATKVIDDPYAIIPYDPGVSSIVVQLLATNRRTTIPFPNPNCDGNCKALGFSSDTLPKCCEGLTAVKSDGKYTCSNVQL